MSFSTSFFSSKSFSAKSSAIPTLRVNLGALSAYTDFKEFTTLLLSFRKAWFDDFVWLISNADFSKSI